MSVLQALATQMAASRQARAQEAAARQQAMAQQAASANAAGASIANAALGFQANMAGLQGELMQADAGIRAGRERALMENALRNRMLGLEQDKFGLARAMSLADYGQGPLAARTPDLTDLTEMLGGRRQQQGQVPQPPAPQIPTAPGASGTPSTFAPWMRDVPVLNRFMGSPQQQPQAAPQPGPTGVGLGPSSFASDDFLREYAKRMILANPNRTGMLERMTEIFRNSDTTQLGFAELADRGNERAFKREVLSDPNAMFASLAPHVLTADGIGPTNLQQSLAALRQALGAQQTSGVAASSPPTFSSLSEAAAAMTQPEGQSLLQALGISESPTAYDAGVALLNRLDSLKPADLQALQRMLAAAAQANPNFRNKVAGGAPTAMIEALLRMSPQSISAEELRRAYEARRQEINSASPYDGPGFPMFSL